MSVWALGINHTTAALDLRGRFAFSIEQTGALLHSLRQGVWGHLAQAKNQDLRQDGAEATIVSTCNRTEIYGTGDTDHLEKSLDWLAQTGGVSTGDLRPHVYRLQAAEATRHAFRVASGLDSMVLGEPQILGQMKDAVRAADQAGAVGRTLNQLFQRSFAVAKEVRSATEIGAHSISMAAAAVRLASALFEDLSQIRVLFVGAGEMIELAATHFAAQAPQQMMIANRTLARGEKLAQRFGAELMRLSELPERLHEFDAVISCTASSLPLIGLGAVERALKKRRHRPMFMLDLAVPRDIEPEVKALDDVYLYTVDDLATVVQSGREQRQAAVAQAEAIIDAGVQNFMHWLAARQHVPLIQQLQTQTEQWQALELARARRQLSKGLSVDEVLQQMSKSLTQKMLHGAMAELHAAEPHARERAAQAIEHFFLRH